MARPRLPGMVSAPKSTLERHPEHVQAIGMISIEMANLEIMLGELLAALLHVAPAFGRIIYLTPHAALGRLAILENVTAAHLVEKTEGRTYIDKIIKRTRAVIGKRHKYIHDSWGVSLDDPTKIVKQSLPFDHKDTPAEPIHINELTGLVTDIRELTDDVRRTAAESFQAWPPYTWRDTPP